MRKINKQKNMIMFEGMCKQREETKKCYKKQVNSRTVCKLFARCGKCTDGETLMFTGNKREREMR